MAEREFVHGTMPLNLLVTGPPRSGKTTVIRKMVDRLEREGYRVGGLSSPDRREGGDRVGFDIEDVMTGESRLLAHVNRDQGPSVGKYRVATENVDVIAESAFHRAFDEADVIVIDEIAPMEAVSEPFRDHVRRALDGEWPVLAAVHYRSTSGFIGAVKERDDVESFAVTPETRDALPDQLAVRLLGELAG